MNQMVEDSCQVCRRVQQEGMQVGFCCGGCAFFALSSGLYAGHLFRARRQGRPACSKRARQGCRAAGSMLASHSGSEGKAGLPAAKGHGRLTAAGGQCRLPAAAA